jgi:hypothetical protein
MTGGQSAVRMNDRHSSRWAVLSNFLGPHTKALLWRLSRFAHSCSKEDEVQTGMAKPVCLWFLVRNEFGSYLKSVDGHATARRD